MLAFIQHSVSRLVVRCCCCHGVVVLVVACWYVSSTSLKIILLLKHSANLLTLSISRKQSDVMRFGFSISALQVNRFVGVDLSGSTATCEDLIVTSLYMLG